MAPEKYYGGVIPGGIFIEQSPEVAQFEPSFATSEANNTAFCPGDNVTLTAKVKYPGGSNRGKYYVALWTPVSHDAFQAGTSSLKPLVDLGGNMSTNTTGGFTIKTDDDPSAGTATFTITMSKATFQSIANSEGTGNTDLKKLFRFVVTEGNTAPTPTTKAVTKETSAQYMDIPKLYLNVVGSFKGINIFNEPGFDREAGTPVDKITSAMANAQVYMRNDCKLNMSGAGIDMGCYYKPGEEPFKTETYASAQQNTGYAKLSDENTVAGMNQFATVTTLGENPMYYYNQYTWTTGCVSVSDTVRIEPRGKLEAPSLSIFSDCLHLLDDEKPFRMQASAAAGTDIQEWQWVIRAEDGGQPELKTHERVEYAHPKIGYPVDFDADPEAPLKPGGSNFGGGYIFNVGASGYTASVDNGYDESEDGTIQFTIAFKNQGTSSSFSVTRVAGGAFSWPTLFGQWLPTTPDIGLGSGVSDDYSNYGCQWAGEAKWVYVRYKTSYGEWSPWTVKPTGTNSDCENNLPVQYFGITHAGTHCPGTQMSKNTDILLCKTCSADTTVERNTKMQFYLTAFGFDGCKFSISADESIEWYATDDEGNQTIFAKLDGPQKWDWSAHNTAYACGDDLGGVLLIPAPSLYTVTKKVKVRADIVNLYGPRVSSGWFPDPDGSMYIDECIDAVKFDMSGNAALLNDEYVLVEVGKKMGRLEAKRDGVVIPSGDAMCVGSELELSLTGDVDPTATWQWQQYNETTKQYEPIAGATGGTYKYTPDKTVITGLANPDDVWDSGVNKKFRVVVTSDGESKNHDFDVNVFWVEKMVIGSNGAVPAVALTTGVCEGTDVTVIGRPSVADNLAWYKNVTFEYLDGTWQDLGVAPHQESDMSYTTKLESVEQAYWDGYSVRYKGAFPTSNANVTCVAYSDTVTLKVNKLEAGTITTTTSDGKLCAGQLNTVVYNGAGDTFEWFAGNTSLATGKTVQLTPAGSAGGSWTVKVKVTQGTGDGACEVEVSKTFTLKSCNITLTPSPAAFCLGDATVAANGVTLTLGTPGAVAKLSYKTSTGAYSDIPAAQYDATAAATDGTIKLSADFAKALAVGTYIFKATMVTNSVETDEGELVVNALPTLTNLRNTSNGPVCEGSDLTFTASATASQSLTPTYKWYYAATETAANSHNGTAVANDGNHEGATRATLTLKTTAANQATLNGRWYYAEVTATNNTTGCTATAYTPAAQAVVNKLPDMNGVVTGTGIDGTAGITSLSKCAGKGVVLEVTTDATKGYTYIYTWKKGSANVPSGVTATNDGNNGSKLTFTDAAATTGNSGAYTLTVEATNAAGCKQTTTQTLTITFANCGADKLTDGASGEYNKSKPYVVCANDVNWPVVDVREAALPATGGGNALVTAVTLYHRYGATGAFAVAGTSAAGTIPFDVKNAAVLYSQAGSHYYFAKIERTGYAPTYTDTAEYVIGALPVNGLANAKVMATSTVANNDPTVVSGPTADLKACEGLFLTLSLSGMPADGTDAFAEAGVSTTTSYRWYKGASSTVPDNPSGSSLSQYATAELNEAVPGAGGQSGYYYAYREYKRNTTINSTKGAQTCSTTFKVPAAAKITVNPKPGLPTAIASSTENLCEGGKFDLTTTTTPNAAASGTTWKYRWSKKRGSGSATVVYPTDGGYLSNLNAIEVPASAAGATSTVTDVYTLKVYGETTEGCVDSTAALSGITVKITPLPKMPTFNIDKTTAEVCEGSTTTLTITASGGSVPSGTAYQWYKMAGSSPAAGDPAVTNASGRYSGATTATLTITGNVTSGSETAGTYYARMTAANSSNAACSTQVATDNRAVVTVNPLPVLTGLFTGTAGGDAGFNTNVCTGDEPLLVLTPDASKNYTYKYTWLPPVTVPDQSKPNEAKVPKSETASAGTKTYTVPVEVTTAAGCKSSVDQTFTVVVSACDRDVIADDKNAVKDESTPYLVCEDATAWPKVKIRMNNMAGRTIEQVVLYHSYNSKASADFKAVKTWTPSFTTGDVMFDPLTETSASGDNLKQTGSHYYYANVKRSGTTTNLTTLTVEYVVGAVPSATLLDNTVITVSLTDPAAADATASLAVCEGTDAYVALKNEPAAGTLSGQNTSLTKYLWFKESSATNNPSTAYSATGNKFGFTGSGKAAQSDAGYYYAQIQYTRTTPIKSTNKNQSCPATLKVSAPGVLTVNPMPQMPTKVDIQLKGSVCDGETFDLGATLTPSAPSSGTTWTYRWYKKRGNGTEVPVYPASASDPALTSPTKTGIAADVDGSTSAVTDAYRLEVLAVTDKNCSDKTEATKSISILPMPTASPTVSGGGKVCAGGTITLTVSEGTVTGGQQYGNVQWYKLRAQGAQPDKAQDTRLTQTDGLYTDPTQKTMTVTAKTAASGYYYAVVPLRNTTACLDTVYSGVAQVEVVPQPVVRIADTSFMTFYLCPDGEQTQLSVTLDAATLSQVSGGQATVTYQWYKGGSDGKGTAISGATNNTLLVKASEIGANKSENYNIKITKAETAFSCPTELWLTDAWSADNNQSSGMGGKKFTVTVRASCSESIIDKEAPNTNLTRDKATAICSADADPGKTFQIKPDANRLIVSKATWYYAPVTEQGGKLVRGTITTGKSCTNLPSGQAGCDFNTKTDGNMTSTGEWQLWAEVERAGANKTTTDTIHFVIRPNPSLANDGSYSMILQTQSGPTTVSDWFVCQGTDVQLTLDQTPVFVTNDATGTEHRSDTITYAWDCENCTGVVKNSDPVWKYNSTQWKAAVTSTGAPAAAAYENDMRLQQEYRRRFERNTSAHPHAGMPTYNIVCPVMDNNTAYVKTLRGKVYTSEAARGTLRDASGNTNSSHCSSGSTTDVTLKFTPADDVPQTKVTVWEYAEKASPAEGDWKTWQTVAANASTPNELTIDFSDSKLTKPASGETKTYSFRVKVQNGKCDRVVSSYALTFEGAPEVGTLTVPSALCADNSGAGTAVEVKAADVKPANASVTFSIYKVNPTSGSPTALVNGTATCSNGAATWNASINETVTTPTTYYVRYAVSGSSATCGTVYSTVEEITLYPQPAFSFATGDPELCLVANSAKAELSFTAGNVDEIKIYSFPESKTEAELKAAITGGTQPIHTVTSAEIAAKKAEITYNGSNMYADDSKKTNSRTYFYAVAKQSALSSVPAAAACVETIGGTSIRTAEPVVKPVIGWNADVSLKLTGPVETNARSNVYLKNGENGNGTSLLSAVKKEADGNAAPDYANAKTENFNANPYSFQAHSVDTLYVWASVQGYNGCPKSESDTIKIAVQTSSKYTAERVEHVCGDGTISCWIVANSGQGGIANGSYKWAYKLQSASTWTDVPVTAGALDECKIEWSNHGLAEGAYDFKMIYKTGSGKDEETMPVTVNVHAAPVLSAQDALNISDNAATCEGTAFQIKLKDGVTASAATRNLQFSRNPAADDDAWTNKTGSGNVLYEAKAVADSGWYRLRVFTHEVCDTLVSDMKLLAVNKKPTAGALTMSPSPVCFGESVTLTLDGHEGTISDYEYNPKHSGTLGTDKPANPQPDEMVWRSVGNPSPNYPIKPDSDFKPDADGHYPATWTVKDVKHGYSIRAKITNGVCPAAYALGVANVFDTVAVKTQPKNYAVVVDQDSELPSEDVVFTTEGQWSNAKYVDGSVMAQPTTDITYRWRISLDEGKTWRNISGAGVENTTLATLRLKPAFWEFEGMDKDVLLKTRFRCLVMGACKDTVRTMEVRVQPQTSLRAGTVDPQIPNSAGCFFYGDTVVLFHEGASGQGLVSHHWRVGPPSNPTSSNVKTFEEMGIKYRFGKNGDDIDSSKVYLIAPENPAGGLEVWWASRSSIYVFVTDALNPVTDLFDASGHLKKTPDAEHYASRDLCFRHKPKWEFQNDTICLTEQGVAFELKSDVDLDAVAASPIGITLLRFTVKARSEMGFRNVLRYNADGSDMKWTEDSYTVEDTKSVSMTMEKGSDGKPTGKMTITAKTPSNALASAFDSLLIRTVVKTDFTQGAPDTLYAVLRIDQGIKQVTPVAADLTVCEGKDLTFGAGVERATPSILSEIKWQWRREDKDLQPASTYSGSSSAQAPQISLTEPDIEPSDAGAWTLRVTPVCGNYVDQAYNVTVNALPKWESDLAAAEDDLCAGQKDLSLSATLKVNWEPGMTWEHALTAAGPWTPVAINNARVTAITDKSVTGKIGYKLDFTPSYVRDSGYYRIALKAPDGSACAGETFNPSQSVHVRIDTVPLLEAQPASLSLGLDVSNSGSVTIAVKNPGGGASSLGWFVIDAGKTAADAVPIADFVKEKVDAGLLDATDMEDNNFTLNINKAKMPMNGIKLFMKVKNDCGEVTSAEVPVTVAGALEFDDVEDVAVCEGSEAVLTVKATMKLADTWEYATPDAPDAWKVVNAGAPEPLNGATHSMDASGTAKLTISGTPYSLDGYRFRLGLNYGGNMRYSDPMTLVVRPVENLHIMVKADPNPASDYVDVTNSANSLNRTDLKAVVYVGDAPELDANTNETKLPENARVLTAEELELYGYTTFDWYQITNDGSAVNTPNDASGIFKTTGDLHETVYKLTDLTYADHNMTRYFAILRNACFGETDLENQQRPTDFVGLYSDTTTLRIYEDLLLEWQAGKMWTDTLPFGTTSDDLETREDVPTNLFIPIALETPDPGSKHQISSAYYVACGDGNIAELFTELREGVQSEDDEAVMETRLLKYRVNPEAEWQYLFMDERTGSSYLESPDGESAMTYLDFSRREMSLEEVYSWMNGYQFQFVAYADRVVWSDGTEGYRYKDSTPVLTLIVSEPIPMEIAFEPDRADEDCNDHDYVFDLSGWHHESFRYEWEIKRPGEADFSPIAEMDNRTPLYTFGKATPEDDGTVVRVTVHNYCGEVTLEETLRVMTVDLSAEATELCADGTLELTAAALNAGDNPTYAWYVDGTRMEDETGTAFTLDPAVLDLAAGSHIVEVRVTADPNLAFVNDKACASAEVAVHALPAGVEATVDPGSVTIVDSATLRVSGAEGCTVTWTPEEWVHDATSATTSTRPIAESGSHWFVATVTNEHGCTTVDSVELIVISSFTFDSTEAVVVLPPFPFELDEDGLLRMPDTTLQITASGDTLRLTACENSVAFLTLRTSGGDAPLVYAWEGVEPLTAAELEDYFGQPIVLPDSVFAFFLDGELAEFGCTMTERGGDGLSVHLQVYVAYHQTQHVVLEAMPNMRHSRFYENQVVFFTAHPNRFAGYDFYNRNVTADETGYEITDRQSGGKNLYKTDYVYEDGAERTVYVTVADKNGCRSYDSVGLIIIPLPNAMICNDPNYPDADILFPEFEVEIHDSWGRLVKAMDDGLGWDARRGGKQVEGGTYYYRVKIPTADGGFTYVKGAVTVFTKKK